MVSQRWKQVVLAGLSMLILTGTQAWPEYRLSDFNRTSSLGVGYVSVDSRPFFKTSLYPEFGFGPVALAFDLNLYIPLDNKPVPSYLQPLGFRKLSYITNEWGVHWGLLTNQTMGNGLLMENYDSASGGSTEFDTSKAAFKTHIESEPYRVEAMWTGKNLVSGRLQYDLPNFNLLGRPLRLGVTGITDSDGVTDADGTRLRPRTSGLSGDVSIALIEEVLTGYVEVANLYYSEQLDGSATKQGTGAGIGVVGKPASWVHYRLEYRDLGPQFVPSYYGPTYEATGFSFARDAMQSRVSGILGELGGEFADGYLKGELRYEAYSSSVFDPVLSGSLGWKEIASTIGVINFTQRFDRQSRPVATAEVLYKPGGIVNYLFRVKRVYSNFSAGEFEQTFSVEAQMNLDNFVTQFPYLK